MGNRARGAPLGSEVLPAARRPPPRPRPGTGAANPSSSSSSAAAAAEGGGVQDVRRGEQGEDLPPQGSPLVQGPRPRP
ncbi:unnamed protein product, partial [Musa textilis]